MKKVFDQAVEVFLYTLLYASYLFWFMCAGLLIIRVIVYFKPAHPPPTQIYLLWKGAHDFNQKHHTQ